MLPFFRVILNELKPAPVAFVFDTKSPHLERLISSVEILGHPNQGVFMASVDHDLEKFLADLSADSIILSGPLNLASVPHLLANFNVICFSFATDIFVAQAHKVLIQRLSPAQLKRLRIVVDTKIAKSVLLSENFSELQVDLIPWSFGLTGLQNLRNFQDGKPIQGPKIIFGRSTTPDAVYQPHLALTVVEMLAEKFDSISLTVVTNQMPEDIVFGSKKKKNLSLNIMRLVGQTEFAKLVSEHDLFLQTNSVDGLSVSMLQSMAVGTPIASTITAGTKEAICDDYSGILFEESHLAHASERIEKLFRNPSNYAFISNNGMSKFIDDFSEEVALERLANAISSSQCKR